MPGCSFRANGRNPLPTTCFHREGLPQMGRQASSALQLCSRQASAHHERLAGLAPSPTRWWMAYYSCPSLICTCQVDPVGFEPTTFSMPLRRAPSCAMGPRLPQVDLAGFEPATSSVRLMRAPNCATGPRRGVEIVPERKWAVKLRIAIPTSQHDNRCRSGGHHAPRPPDPPGSNNASR